MTKATVKATIGTFKEAMFCFLGFTDSSFVKEESWLKMLVTLKESGTFKHVNKETRSHGNHYQHGSAVSITRFVVEATTLYVVKVRSWSSTSCYEESEQKYIFAD